MTFGELREWVLHYRRPGFSHSTMKKHSHYQLIPGITHCCCPSWLQKKFVMGWEDLGQATPWIGLKSEFRDSKVLSQVFLPRSPSSSLIMSNNQQPLDTCVSLIKVKVPPIKKLSLESLSGEFIPLDVHKYVNNILYWLLKIIKFKLMECLKGGWVVNALSFEMLYHSPRLGR